MTNPVFSETPEFQVKLAQTTPSVCDKVHASEDRDRMLFSAGRYAAGARDGVAVKAHQKLMKELGE